MSVVRSGGSEPNNDSAIETRATVGESRGQSGQLTVNSARSSLTPLQTRSSFVTKDEIAIILRWLQACRVQTLAVRQDPAGCLGTGSHVGAEGSQTVQPESISLDLSIHQICAV